MATWTEYASRYSNNSLTDNLKELKNHFNEYFITGDAGKGIVNLKLDIVGDESLTADSDVTDHYVESNIAYQDQISIKPKVYKINGEVGELVWYQKDPISQTYGQVAQRLEGVVSFLPIRSRGFNQLKKKAMKAFQWIDTASNAVSKLANLTDIGNNQQQAYMRLLEFRDARIPITIKSPWGVLQNYVITSLKLTQPKETKDKSLISITFKEFRTTSVSTVKFDPQKYQGNAAFENQPKVDNGQTDGTDVSISRKATSSDSGNPFKQIGETTREGNNYFSQTSDGSKILNVWYNSELHDFAVTDMYDNIVTGKEQAKAFASVKDGISTAIGKKYGNPPLR